METETLDLEVAAPVRLAPVPLWNDPNRWLSWCDTCDGLTESDDTTCRWCLQCGERREN